jgi:hypothetical protein
MSDITYQSDSPTAADTQAVPAAAPRATTSVIHRMWPVAVTTELIAIDAGDKPRRQRVLTKEVMAGIPVLVEQGLNAQAIAERLGCKVSTLKVRCSQARISLRTPRPNGCGTLAPKQPRRHRAAFTLETSLQLSRVAMSRLRQRAAEAGVSEAKLATDLLEVIAQDDLYDAVLDRA